MIEHIMLLAIMTAKDLVVHNLVGSSYGQCAPQL